MYCTCKTGYILASRYIIRQIHFSTQQPISFEYTAAQTAKTRMECTKHRLIKTCEIVIFCKF